MNTPTLFSLDTVHSSYLEGMVRLYNAQTAVVFIAPFPPIVSWTGPRRNPISIPAVCLSPN